MEANVKEAAAEMKNEEEGNTESRVVPSAQEKETRWYQAWAKKFCTKLILGALLFVFIWCLTGQLALPKGYIFSIFIIYVTALLFSAAIGYLKVPQLVGMLIAGLLIRNFPVGQEFIPSPPSSLSSMLRNLAFAVILVRAGLGLDVGALLRLKRAVLLLAAVPGCCVEAPVVALAAHLLLGLEWMWGLMLGFIVAAVSPAVVVPGLLSLQARGLGVVQGVPSLIIAAASVDDVIAIAAFSVALGASFSTGILWIIIKAPLEILSGILGGAFFGAILWVCPGPSPYQFQLRFIFLFLLASSFLIGSSRLDFGSAGALGALACAFVAGLNWRKGDMRELEAWFRMLWVFLMPFLFGLIGYEIDLSVIDITKIGYGLIVIVAGLTFRIVASLVCAWGPGLGWRERLFIAIAWVPKATVQAAIGAIPLDTARQQEEPDEGQIQAGSDILTLAVLAILLTAPIGALAIHLSGPRLLTPQPQPTPQLATCQKFEEKTMNNCDENQV